jgi:hypothetical protein
MKAFSSTTGHFKTALLTGVSAPFASGHTTAEIDSQIHGGGGGSRFDSDGGSEPFSNGGVAGDDRCFFPGYLAPELSRDGFDKALASFGERKYNTRF